MTQTHTRLFRSFFHGGFECSSHCLKDGRRLDQLAATRHDEFAAEDYARLRAHGIAVAREGIRWHLIERVRGWYDWKSALPMVRAARDAGMQVIWDLCHFGWPDNLDPFGTEFVDRFARMARAFAQLVVEETGEPIYISPINEISFLSWVGAEVGDINPGTRGRGFELKCNLVRATLAAIDGIREVAPETRFFQIEPVFNVIPTPERPQDAEAAEQYRQYQFQVWDMLIGRLWPQLGGDERYLDVIGVNYYPWNQWFYDGPLHGGATLSPGAPGWRPFEDMLAENHARYGRPLYLAETGCENEKRAPWLRATGDAVAAALARGLPVEGVCLYPIVNFPGWENGRHCHNGLWDYANDQGEREIHAPLAEELSRQQARFAEPAVLYGAGMEARLALGGGRLL